MLNALTENEIDYRHFFYPLHKQPFINSTEVLSNSEYAFDHGLILPTYSELKNSQIDYIANIILKTI